MDDPKLVSSAGQAVQIGGAAQPAHGVDAMEMGSTQVGGQPSESPSPSGETNVPTLMVAESPTPSGAEDAMQMMQNIHMERGYQLEDQALNHTAIKCYFYTYLIRKCYGKISLAH